MAAITLKLLTPSFNVQNIGAQASVPQLKLGIIVGTEGWLAPAQAPFLFNVELICTLSGGKPPFPTCVYFSLSNAWEVDC